MRVLGPDSVCLCEVGAERVGAPSWHRRGASGLALLLVAPCSAPTGLCLIISGAWSAFTASFTSSRRQDLSVLLPRLAGRLHNVFWWLGICLSPKLVDLLIYGTLHQGCVRMRERLGRKTGGRRHRLLQMGF